MRNSPAIKLWDTAAMRHFPDLSTLRALLIKGLTGPQMLAFLPALCLSAYWVGGEPFLVICALAVPLIYAAFGGTGHWVDSGPLGDLQKPSVEAVAKQFLGIAQHNGQTTACLQIAIPQLEGIIERFGPDRAVEARILIASRLRSALRAPDHVFETGPMRFTVLIAPGFRLRLDNLLELAKRLRASAEEPLLIDGVTCSVSATIGIASSLNFGRNVTADSWLRSATEALEEAMLNGESATRLWSDRLSRHHKSRNALETEITSALDQGRIQAVFQPVITLRTGLVCGMEAFARWDHPTRGLLTASEFLDAARDANQMSRLGRTMFLQATTVLRAWDAAGFTVGTISLNLSEDELRDPDLAARIKGDVMRCDLPAHRLVFDLPEAVLTKTGEDVIRRNLELLTELGCALDLDVCASGGTSPIALQHLRLSRVKLDRSLIRGIDTSNDQRRALHAVLAMCDRLELGSVATCVETQEEHGVLRDLGCGAAQGHLFAPPSSAEEIGLWLKEQQVGPPEPTQSRIRRIK